MPSGAKKRKAAAKKKVKKGNAQSHNSTSTTNTINDGSSTHSQGSDDVRSVDGRESDLSEIEHEEKGETVRKEETGGEGQEEENVEVETESQFNNENPIGSGGDSSRVDEAQEAPIDLLQEKAVAVDQDSEQQQSDSGTVVGETMKPADYLPEVAIGAKGTMVEQVYNFMEERVPVTQSEKEVLVPSPQEGNDDAFSTQTSPYEEGSVAVKSKEEDFAIPEERKEIPISSSAKIGSEVVGSGTTTDGKSSNNYREVSEDKSVATAALRGDDDDDGIISNKSEEKVVETSRDMAHVKNGESLKGSDEQTSASVVVRTSSPGVDNGKHSEEDQPSLIGSTGIPVRRTSWLNCCGLFEAFSGSR